VRKLLHPVFWLYLAGYYLYNLMISVDQSLGALLGGSPDVTICGRMGLWAERGITLPARILDKIFGTGHCARAIERDPGDKSAWGKAVERYRQKYGKKGD
jgi:hypothetical protein